MVLSWGKSKMKKQKFFAKAYLVLLACVLLTGFNVIMFMCQLEIVQEFKKVIIENALKMDRLERRFMISDGR